MSRPYLEMRAARLPEPARAEFLMLHAQATDLMRQGGSLLRAAWALYRRNRLPRGKHETMT